MGKGWRRPCCRKGRHGREQLEADHGTRAGSDKVKEMGGGDHQGTFGHQGEAAGAHGAMGRDVGVRREKGRVSACLGDGYEKPPDRGHVLEQGVSVCDKNKRRDNVYR
jgi:hypothetical protein